MSDDRIYIRFKGKTLGPLTAQKVQDLIRRGQITRMHDLSSDGLAWVKAEEFGNFFRVSQSVAEPTATASAARAMAVAEVPLVAESSSKPRAGEPPVNNVDWYAHVANSNRGPLSTLAMTQMIASGEIVPDTLVWRSGFDDWKPAFESFPDQFAGSQSHSSSQQSPSMNSPVVSSTGAASVSSDVIDRILRPRGWILYLSISIFVYAGLSVIYCVTTMIVGAEVRWLPTGGASAVVVGLVGLAVDGLVITGGILLLRYAISLRTLSHRRDSVSALLAMRRLEAFWQYSSIAMLVLQVLFVGGAILFITIGFAAVDASN